MRVIAGTLGGRVFDSPHNNRTHPMSDKIRGALFNTLGDIEGLTVLDAFAGSGALSFEAISRDAAHVIAVENDAQAQRTIRKNIAALQLEARVVLAGTAVGAWASTHANERFDIVLLDPPYDDLQPDVLQQLVSLSSDDGLVVLSWPGDELLPEFSNFQLVMNRTYGDAQLAYYQR